MKVVNLTLAFRRKYRWPEHYFSVWCLGNFQKSLTTNQFLVSTIFFFTIINIYFFQSAFWSLFNHRQKSQSCQEQCSLCCRSPCFRVLQCTHYGPFQCKFKEIRVLLCTKLGPLQCFSTYFRKLNEIGVLRSIFSDYVISCDYDATMSKMFLSDSCNQSNKGLKTSVTFLFLSSNSSFSIRKIS